MVAEGLGPPEAAEQWMEETQLDAPRRISRQKAALVLSEPMASARTRTVAPRPAAAPASSRKTLPVDVVLADIGLEEQLPLGGEGGLAHRGESLGAAGEDLDAVAAEDRSAVDAAQQDLEARILDPQWQGGGQASDPLGSQLGRQLRTLAGMQMWTEMPGPASTHGMFPKYRRTGITSPAAKARPIEGLGWLIAGSSGSSTEEMKRLRPASAGGRDRPPADAGRGRRQGALPRGRSTSVQLTGITCALGGSSFGMGTWTSRTPSVKWATILAGSTLKASGSRR